MAKRIGSRAVVPHPLRDECLIISGKGIPCFIASVRLRHLESEGVARPEPTVSASIDEGHAIDVARRCTATVVPGVPGDVGLAGNLYDLLDRLRCRSPRGG